MDNVKALHQGVAASGTVIIVDAPNVDAVVGNMHGRTPTRAERFDPAALLDWAQEQFGDGVEATLFTNVTEPVHSSVQGWIKHLVDNGWRVFARPKLHPADDIDDDMIAHLHAKRWERVIVFSHDSACFAQPLTRLAFNGTDAIVVGFRECAGRLPDLTGVRYVDAAEINGMYKVEPPRIRITNLPAAGLWIEKAAV